MTTTAPEFVTDVVARANRGTAEARITRHTDADGAATLSASFTTTRVEVDYCADAAAMLDFAALLVWAAGQLSSAATE